MRRATVIISLAVHAGVAWSLIGAATQGEKRKAIQVAVAHANKKAEPPKPPPPPPPRPRAAPKVVATAPKPAAAAEAPKPVARAVVATALAMSNDDAPGGIAIGPGGGGGPSGTSGAAPTRVASAVSSARTRRAREALGQANAGGPEAGGSGQEACSELPTRPVPIVQTEIEYSAAARAEGIEGKLRLRITVAADGSVSDVEVVAGVEPALDAAAVATVKQWRFTPAMRCGRPVAGGTWLVQRRFELTD